MFRRRSVCLSDSPLVTNVYFAKSADSIEMPFGVVVLVFPGNRVLDGGYNPSREGANWRNKVNRQNVTHRENAASVMWRVLKIHWAISLNMLVTVKISGPCILDFWFSLCTGERDSTSIHLLLASQRRLANTTLEALCRHRVPVTVRFTTDIWRRRLLIHAPYFTTVYHR